MHPFNLNGLFHTQLVLHHLLNHSSSLFPLYTMIFSDFFKLEIISTRSIFKIINTITYGFFKQIKNSLERLLAHQLNFHGHV